VRVIWTPEAVQDRVDIWDYIAADNAHAAALIDELFSDAAARLADHPRMGKPGMIPGTRELFPPKIIGCCTKSAVKRCGFWLRFMRPANGRPFRNSRSPAAVAIANGSLTGFAVGSLPSS